MKALEFLKQNRVYEDETIYNSVGEIVGTISQLMEEYAALRQPPVSKSLASHLCPVCNGNGLVPNGFYMQTSSHWSTSSITPETCRSCGGTGIVWG